MGPQHVRCGMVPAPAGIYVYPAVLQWGRNMFVAECGQFTELEFETTHLQWGRNMFVAECLDERDGLVILDCLQWGRNMFVAECYITSTIHLQTITLQWGRNMFVAECNISSSVYFSLLSLQWGRNMFVAECPQSDTDNNPRGRPSMGPQHVRCGMQFGSVESGLSHCSFNGAATCSLRNARLPAGCGSCAWPSMGPQHVRCGMPPAPAPAAAKSSNLQWGRNMFVAECREHREDVSQEFVLQWGRNMFVAE